ncbi:MAG: hypothetical protein EU550_00340 [Promethearchaeota archaeon]|nr:MAG: hypothetical protein EU550_00340 [Candidatus Lokiarchaeota archaeon]
MKKQSDIVFFKAINFKDSQKENSKRRAYSFLSYFKKKIPLNLILLIVFLFLICVLNLVRVSNFIGTDSWLHISIIKFITELEIVPFEAYLGNMGLHIFGAVIQFFSSAPLVSIPRYFVFYTFPISALIFYVILKRIIHNRNFVIFGVFLLEFSSLGFSIMMYQFWPTNLAVIQGLIIFYILYTRLERIIEVKTTENLSKRIELKRFTIDYTLIGIIFLSSLLTHSLITIIMFSSYLFIFVLYFVRDYKSFGLDFIFLCALGGFFLILNSLGFASGHFDVFNLLRNINPFFILIGGTIGGIGGFILIWSLKNTIKFKSGNFYKVVKGEKYSYYKKIEDHYILPVLIGAAIFYSLFFLFFNSLLFNFSPLTLLTTAETFLLCSLGLWGLLLYKKKPKGKVVYFWGAAFLILLGVGFAFDFLIGVYKLWSRIFYLMSPVVVIGFITYLYKLTRTRDVSSIYRKIFILGLIGFSLISTYSEEIVTMDEFGIKNREISVIRWYSNYTDNKNLLVLEFGWNHVFMYYDYPYNKNNRSISLWDVIEYKVLNLTYANPDSHITINGTNILQDLKQRYDMNLYIIIPNYFLAETGWNFFISISKEQRSKYFNLSYINRICISEGDNEEVIPLYWII